jgi:diguanylate cyclase (GGDEF)-like protein/PAS domain S-box-containing protein
MIKHKTQIYSLLYSCATFFLLAAIWEFGINDSHLRELSEAYHLLAYFCIFSFSLVVFTLTSKSERESLREVLDSSSSDELAQSIFHHAHDAIITIDIDSKVTRWNKMAETIFGWSQSEVLNKKLTDLIIPLKLNDAHTKGITQFISTGEGPVLNTCIELLAINKAGDEVPIEITISAVSWKNSFIFSGIIRDISERKQMEQELQLNQVRLEENNQLLQKISTEDGLTLIPNRRFFDDFLHNEWKRAARDKYPISLVMIDIDFFKPFNDIYGHQSGDECLKKVAKAIQKVLHRPADIVSRYGGEEFVVVLPETEGPGAFKISEEIRKQIELLHVEHSGNTVSSYVTASLGVDTMMPDESLKDPKLLIRRADKALYEAKNQGKNRVVVGKSPENN